jgi:periplasmic protein TonB
MAAYVHDQGYAKRRSVVLISIVAFHVLLIYGFSSGLVPKIIEQIAPPIQTTILKEEKPKDELPPPPPPKMEEPPVQVVAPEISINISADAPPPPITMVTTQPPPVVVARPPPPGTKLVPISIPNPEDMYPSAARNAGQEGKPVVNFCLDEKGRITSAEVAESSTFPLLDEAAIKVVRGGRFKPATQEGKPIASCARIPIKFQLKKS